MHFMKAIILEDSTKIVYKSLSSTYKLLVKEKVSEGVVDEYIKKKPLPLPTEREFVARISEGVNKVTRRLLENGHFFPEAESITKESIPNKISYLSIDLNSAIPTISALEHFYPILERNGIILFDDYGWEDYIETRKAINIFFNDKSGILMPLPTGQAIYFNVCVDVLHDK